MERQNIKCEVIFEMEMTYPRMIDFCEWRQSERSDVGDKVTCPEMIVVSTIETQE